MADNDRVDASAADMRIPKPEVEIVVQGKTVHKPGMKSFLMEADTSVGASEQVLGSEGYVVGGTVCVCDLVVKSTPCSSYNSCSTYKSGSSGGGGSYCSCNKICTCNRVT